MRPGSSLLAAFLFLTGGCVQYHYSPNLVQTPFIDKKGDGMVMAAIGGGPTSVSEDFHASFSPVKHGTLELNYFHTHSSFQDNNIFGGTSYLQTARGYLLEGALGGYTPFAFGTAAMYIGWGQGRMRNDYGIQRISDLKLQRFFVQPTFTFKNDWFRLGMGLRLVRLSFPSGKVDYRIDPSDIDIIQRIEKDSPIWFPEIGGNIGVHFKPVTISANLVIVALNTASNYGFDSSNLGLGITFELQEMFKKRSKK